MSHTSIHLEAIWEIEARRREIAEVLTHAESYANWWGGVYLSSELIEKGNDDGVGRVVNLRSKGLVPYDLNWSSCVAKSDLPDRWNIETLGDLCGFGVWKLIRGPSSITVHLDWTIVTRDTPLANVVRFARPLMAFNHRWAMRRGLEGLVGELQRRRNARPSPTANGLVRGRCLAAAVA